MTKNMQFDKCVDARGLSCPLPLLKARLALNGMPAGAVLKVMATDAGSQRDLRSFAVLAGHLMLHEELTNEQIFIYFIQKGAAPD